MKHLIFNILNNMYIVYIASSTISFRNGGVVTYMSFGYHIKNYNFSNQQIHTLTENLYNVFYQIHFKYIHT